MGRCLDGLKSGLRRLTWCQDSRTKLKGGHGTVPPARKEDFRTVQAAGYTLGLVVESPLAQGADFRLGQVEDFRLGRVEDFRPGRVEDFRLGRVVDFRLGRVVDFRLGRVVDFRLGRVVDCPQAPSRITATYRQERCSWSTCGRTATILNTVRSKTNGDYERDRCLITLVLVLNEMSYLEFGGARAGGASLAEGHSWSLVR